MLFIHIYWITGVFFLTSSEKCIGEIFVFLYWHTIKTNKWVARGHCMSQVQSRFILVRILWQHTAAQKMSNQYAMNMKSTIVWYLQQLILCNDVFFIQWLRSPQSVHINWSRIAPTVRPIWIINVSQNGAKVNWQMKHFILKCIILEKLCTFSNILILPVFYDHKIRLAQCAR